MGGRGDFIYVGVRWEEEAMLSIKEAMGYEDEGKGNFIG